MQIIYHNKDFDGYCSGAIAKMFYPEGELIGYDHGQPLPEFSDNVILLDMSFKVDIMKSIRNLTWVDHHKIVEPFIDEPFCKGKLEIGRAACELTWELFYPNTIVPRAVKLLSDYDVKNDQVENWASEVLPFQYGIRARSNSVETFPIDVFSNDELTDIIIREGRLIMKYQIIQDEQTSRSSFEHIFNGLRAICINVPSSMTLLDSVYNPDNHDIKIYFVYTGKFWKVTLHSNKVDVSEIANSYGGGGHAGAAGFQVENIEDLFPNINKR